MPSSLADARLTSKHDLQTVQIHRPADNTYSLTVRIDSLGWAQFAPGAQRWFPKIPGFAVTSQPLKPILPAYSVMIALPSGNLPLCRVSVGDPQYLIPKESPAIFQDIPKTGTPGIAVEEQFIPDSYPDNHYDLFRMGSVGGVQLASLQIYPVRWVKEKHKYVINRTLDVQVTFPEWQNSSANELGSVIPAVKSSVVNPEMIQQQLPPPRRLSGITPRSGYPAEYQQALKIDIPVDGIYRITARTFRDSIQTSAAVDPATLRLFHKGEEQFVYVKSTNQVDFRGGDYLEFIAEVPKYTFTDQYHDPFNQSGVYWLVWGQQSGLRFVPQSVEPIDPNPYYVRSFRNQIHVEKSTYFDRLGDVETGEMSHQVDHWFHSNPLVAGTIHDFQFNLWAPNRTSLRDISLRVGFRGLSTESARDHRAALYINDNYVGQTAVFTGKSEYVYNGGVGYPVMDLLDGENTISIATNQVTNEYESLALNWFEVKYDRLFRATNDYLRFYPPENIQLSTSYEHTISGFADPAIRIYSEKGVSFRNFQTERDPSEGWYNITLQMHHQSPDAVYHAVSDGGVLTPAKITRVDQTELPGAQSQTVDYLIISPSRFTSQLESWADYREAQGWVSEIMTTEEIYRFYNYGYASGNAIRDAIQEYYLDLPLNQTLHVLIVGDTKSQLADITDGIPMPFYQTYRYGAAVTDYFYANLDTTDLLPEIALGRLPVSTADDLSIVLNKIREYESNSDKTLWTNRSLYIAGYDAVFKDQTEELLRFQVGKRIFPERLYIDLSSTQSRFYGGADDLLQYFNQGMYHINFMGHGGGAVWADRSLFLREDVAKLDNQLMAPFITSMTCFTGAMETNRGLGELMMLAENGGAIGWFGSSGLGWIWNDFLLVYDMPAYLQDPDLTLGEITNAARINYIARAPRFGYSYLLPTMLYQYNLIGDPATRMPIPDRGDELLSLNNPSLESGESLVIRSAENRTTWIQIYNPDHIPLWDEPRRVSWQESGSEFEYSIQLPDTYTSSQGHVSFFQSGDPGNASRHGMLRFGVDAPIISDMQTAPGRPRTREEVRFLAEVFTQDVPDSVLVFTTRAGPPLKMEQLAGNQWQTVETLDGAAGGVQVEWWLKIYLRDGTVVTGPKAQFQVEFLPDLQFVSASINHGIQPTLEVIVATSEPVTVSENTTIKLMLITLDDDSLVALENELELTDQKRDTIKTGFYNPGGRLALQYNIDPHDLVIEESEADNLGSIELTTSIYAVTPSLGLTLDGFHPDVVRDSLFIGEVLPGSVSTPSTVEIEFTQIEFDSHRWQMAPAVNRDEGTVAVSVTPQPDVPYEIPVRLTSTIGTVDSLYRWYRNVPGNAPDWIIMPETAGELVTSLAGDYALFISKDDTPPQITPSVGNQTYLPDMYTTDSPTIRFLIEDSVGVDSRPASMILSIDGDDLIGNSELYSIHRTNSQSVIVTCEPELTSGTHEVQFQGTDIHGNRSDVVELQLITHPGDHLLDYGNFPNPFQAETFFYYELTNQAKSLSLDVYTVDGRRIMHFTPETIYSDHDPTGPGFHRIRWDGRDSRGEFIANGVYFYRLNAKIGNQSFKSIGKIAKAR